MTVRRQLPPYVRDRQETLLERCARLRAELRAVTAAASNDNEPERRAMWWEERD